jgi:hypothetical protein
LADAEFVVDVDPSVDLFAGIAVGFEAVAGFEEFDLIGVLRLGGSGGLGGGFLGWLLGSLLRLREKKNDVGEEI